MLTYSNGKPIAPNLSSGLWVLWFFTVLWNLMAFAGCFAAMDKLRILHRTEDYVLLMTLLFPLVGLFLFWQAIKSTILMVRYGQSRLTMDPSPGQAGGQVGGEIRLSTPLPLDAQCEVRLECLQTRETRNSKGQKRTSISVEWQDAISVRGRREAGKTVVQFVFDVPADLPPSQQKSTHYYHWRVQVAADIPGLDLALDFDVPVEKGTAASRIRIAGRERQQQLLRSQQLAQVLNMEQQGNTLYMHSDYGRELTGSLLALVFGCVFFGVGVGIGLTNMGSGVGAGFIAWPIKLLFCTVFGGLGLIMLLTGILTPLTRLDCAIDAQSVHVRRRFLGWVVYRKSIPLQGVTRLEAHRNGSHSVGGRTRNWFQIRVQHEGRHQVIAESVPGRVLADEVLVFLRQNSGLP